MMRQAKKERARLMRIDRGNKSINQKKRAKTSQESFGDSFQDSHGRSSYSRESREGRTTFLNEPEDDLMDFKNLENEVKSEQETTDMMMKFNSTGNHDNLGDMVFDNEETIEEDFEHGGDTNRHLRANMRLEGDDDIKLEDSNLDGDGLGSEVDDEFNETQRLDKFAKKQEESEVGDMDDLIDEMM